MQAADSARESEYIARTPTHTHTHSLSHKDAFSKRHVFQDLDAIKILERHFLPREYVGLYRPRYTDW
jgi:hypothetical protein